MDGSAPSATPSSDTVVDVRAVNKTFRQRQRTGALRDVFQNLFAPTFRDIPAVRDLDLTVRRGEVVAYAGANGAGKSTTIKMLAGLLAPDSGAVRVLGLDPIRDRTRYVGQIGVVFGQRTELWNDHPVAASFAWKRVVWDIPRERYERMTGFVREVLGLDDFFQTQARELSLGQRMRADLGLALVHEPTVLFLDEPTLGLDVLAQRKILEFLQYLNRERRVTILVTSHDMSELEQLAGRIVMIDKGRLAFDGDFRRLRHDGGDRRTLIVETAEEAPPTLHGAEYVRSEARRHEYTFDATQCPIADLLAQAAAQTRVLDVETSRAPIDEVIADLYQRWQGAPSLPGTKARDGRMDP